MLVPDHALRVTACLDWLPQSRRLRSPTMCSCMPEPQESCECDSERGLGEAGGGEAAGLKIPEPEVLFPKQEKISIHIPGEG